MRSLQKFYHAVWDNSLARRLRKVYQAFLFASGAAIVLAMLATVLMRYVFKTDLFGMEEVVLTVAIWFYFLGAANGSMEDSQIRADITTVIIKSAGIRRFLRILTRLIEIVVLVFFIVMTVRLLITNFIRFPTTQGLKIPYVVPQMAIAIGFVLMLFYTIGHLLVDIAPEAEAAPDSAPDNA
ncbi:MAG: TRAP transporter small permease [Planctomycetes bacterium]|nr:TRAP transporter small permease [Planctomycetota bacterium]